MVQNKIIKKLEELYSPFLQGSENYCIILHTEYKQLIRVSVFQAIAMEVHPLYVMLPCTIASSLAFMLPVATPPNAIAFSFGNLKVLDMVRAVYSIHKVCVLCA